MLKMIKPMLLATALCLPFAVAMAQEVAPAAAPAAVEAPKADAPKDACCKKEGKKCDKKDAKECKKCDKKDGKKCDKAVCKGAYVAKVTGMMCAACEAKVKAAFEGIEGVKSAKACHKGGVVCVVMKEEKVLTKEAADKALAGMETFKVTSVEKCAAKECGKDGKKCEKKDCKDGCKKGDKKVCPPDCKKPCCAKKADAKDGEKAADPKGGENK